MSLRVLVVDDEEFILNGLRVYLEDEGMQVGGAASGEEAIQIADRGTDYDVCIMDMRLPGMNGDTTIRALHAIRPEMRFIIHTGSSDYSIPDDLRALGIGDSQLFFKPLLDMKSLAEQVFALAGGTD